MGHILPDIELIVALRFAVDFWPLFRLHCKKKDDMNEQTHINNLRT